MTILQHEPGTDLDFNNRLACTMHFKHNKTKKWQMDEKISGIKGTKMTKVCPWFVLNIFSQVFSV